MHLPSCFQVQTFSTEPSQFVGRNSVVGIAIRYGLGGPGIESRWEARFSAPVHTSSEAQPASCTMGTGSLSRG